MPRASAGDAAASRSMRGSAAAVAAEARRAAEEAAIPLARASASAGNGTEDDEEDEVVGHRVARSFSGFKLRAGDAICVDDGCALMLAHAWLVVADGDTSAQLRLLADGLTLCSLSAACPGVKLDARYLRPGSVIECVPVRPPAQPARALVHLTGSRLVLTPVYASERAETALRVAHKRALALSASLDSTPETASPGTPSSTGSAKRPTLPPVTPSAPSSLGTPASAATSEGALQSLLVHPLRSVCTPRSQRPRTGPRLKFNSDVLVAEYTPKNSGISPMRGTISLGEMDTRAEVRRDDVYLPLRPMLKKCEPRPSAQPQLPPPAPPVNPALPPTRCGSEAASCSGREGDSVGSSARSPLSSVQMQQRLTALIASESRGSCAPASTDADTEDGAIADGHASAPAQSPKSRGSQLSAAREGAPAVGRVALRLMQTRRALLGGRPIGASEALHALAAELPQLSGATRPVDEELGSSIGDAVELLLTGIAPLLEGEQRSRPRVLLRLLLLLDTTYFDAVYHVISAPAAAPQPLPPAALDVTEAVPFPAVMRLGTDAGLDADALMFNPAAFLRLSHPPKWRKAQHARLRRLLLRPPSLGPTPPAPADGRDAARATGQAWVQLAVYEHERLLAANLELAEATEHRGGSSAGGNLLLSLWCERWVEAHALLSHSGIAAAVEYDKLAPTASAAADKEPPAPPLVRRWRHAERTWPCWMLAFAVPSPAALAALARYAPVIEMGAGVGYWARLLRERGVEVSAFDSTPPPSEPQTETLRSPKRKMNTYHGDSPALLPVEPGGPSTLAQPRWQGHALFLCYPPPRSAMAAKCLDAFCGDTMVHVGEWLGDTGDLAFEHVLASQWELRERLPLPCWGDTAEDLTVWSRRRGGLGKLAETAAHPVLACDSCGRRGSLRPATNRSLPGLLRRCRYCRLACYCSAACAEAGRAAHARYHLLKMIEFERQLDFDGVDFHTVCL